MAMLGDIIASGMNMNCGGTGTMFWHCMSYKRLVLE